MSARRAKQLLKGARPLVESDNKEVVTALREIAAMKFRDSIRSRFLTTSKCSFPGVPADVAGSFVSGGCRFGVAPRLCSLYFLPAGRPPMQSDGLLSRVVRWMRGICIRSRRRAHGDDR